MQMHHCLGQSSGKTLCYKKLDTLLMSNGGGLGQQSVQCKNTMIWLANVKRLTSYSYNPG